MSDYVAGAKQIIADNIYMILATTSADNVPWVSPVFFVYDEHYNFYWTSYTEARHSHNVRAVPKVAISIFNSQLPEGEGDGVYVEADVTQLESESEVTMPIELWNARVTQDPFKISGPEAVTGEGVWRIYRAKPTSISKLTSGIEVNGQYVDNRTEVDLLTP